MKRIDPNTILANGEKLDLQRTYSISVREYIHQGFDGFEALVDCRYIANHDDKIMLIDLSMEFFKLFDKISKKEFAKIDKEALKKEIHFGYDKDLNVIDYIHEISIEENGELNLKVDSPPRIHINQ